MVCAVWLSQCHVVTETKMLKEVEKEERTTTEIKGKQKQTQLK